MSRSYRRNPHHMSGYKRETNIFKGLCEIGLMSLILMTKRSDSFGHADSANKSEESDTGYNFVLILILIIAILINIFMLA